MSSKIYFDIDNIIAIINNTKDNKVKEFYNDLLKLCLEKEKKDNLKSYYEKWDTERLENYLLDLEFQYSLYETENTAEILETIETIENIIQERAGR